MGSQSSVALTEAAVTMEGREEERGTCVGGVGGGVDWTLDVFDTVDRDFLCWVRMHQRAADE